MKKNNKIVYIICKNMLLYKKHKYELFKYVRKCFKKYLGEKYNDKENGQRIAAIAMTVALMGQNVSPIFSLESLRA